MEETSKINKNDFYSLEEGYCEEKLASDHFSKLQTKAQKYNERKVNLIINAHLIHLSRIFQEVNIVYKNIPRSEYCV